jgi:predicted  nucleic acid-binding Zn-ribbon protein
VEKTAEKQEQLKSLETEKAQMIARYLSLQDQADAVNEEIYKVCCGVETINRQIETLQKELKKAAARAAKAAGATPTNGAAHPPTNGHAH